MKNLITLLAALTLLLSSCRKERIADVTIRYEVEATNPNRTYSVYYANTWFGEDVQRNVGTRLFTQEFRIPSDQAPEEFFLSVECFEDRTTSQQRITTRIYEDGRLIIERFTGGSSDIPESRTYISAILPTSIKFEEY